MSASVSKLFSNARNDAADASARSFGAARGLSDEQITKLSEHVTQVVVSAGESLGLDSHDIGEIADLYLHHCIRVASGKFGPEQLKAWDSAVFADHESKMGIGRKAKVRDLFAKVEAWLKTSHPSLYAKLQQSHGFGHHPKVVHHLVSAYRREQDDSARDAKSSTFMKGSKASILPTIPDAVDDVGGA